MQSRKLLIQSMNNTFTYFLEIKQKNIIRFDKKESPSEIAQPTTKWCCLVAVGLTSLC